MANVNPLPWSWVLGRRAFKSMGFIFRIGNRITLFLTGVVELMAAGTVTLAHDSGGPKLDIVTHFKGGKTGFLANSVETYASAMEEIFSMPEDERQHLIKNARQSTERFSERCFEDQFLEAVKVFL